ncbi:TAXI family TRAP transporter solute-binding subunit [Salinisphaera sp. T31B1]|uniref:TAXI family TRAP transporter solute-binding subunit n=1 Tax=Salinisphaera sp. T31B1 TaxID=727963 RepID=UPI00333F74BF
MKSIKRLVACAAVGAMLVLGAAQTAGAAGQSYILATATPGGTFYPVGVGLASLTKVKLEPKTGISLSAISTAGSGENIKLLREDQAQFAILQGVFGAWAWEGEGRLADAGKQQQLRSITMLWSNVEHFVVRKKFVDTGTMADMDNLVGGRFSIGRRNSGTEGSGTTLLTNLGYDVNADFNLMHQGYEGSANALQNGVIGGMNTPGGVPVSAVTRAYAAMGDDVQVLDFTDEEMAKANGKYSLWTRYDIPAGTYPNQDKAIHTVAQPNFLVVNADVSEDDVYKITQAIYENLPFLNSVHSATKVMSLEHALAGLPMPLHPGAARYFREQGVEIPDALQPPEA